MTEEEKQLKKKQIYQEVNLLEKDFLQQYPLDPLTDLPEGIKSPTMMVIGVILLFLGSGFMGFGYIISNRPNIINLIIACSIFVVALMITIRLIKVVFPKYNKYKAAKAVFQKKFDALRRQYDAL
jgi:hypothetical protein